MVVAGDISVQLVNAVTKEPFLEHTGPKGDCYAEVEPDIDYFIAVKRLGDPGAGGTYYVNFYVDGTELDYWARLGDDNLKKVYHGLWSFASGTDTTKALKFQRPKRVDGKSSPPGVLKGAVKVEVSKAIILGTYEANDYDSSISFDPTLDVRATNDGPKSKVLRSSEGSFSESRTRSLSFTNALKGEHVRTITINYCTAWGLIHAGVLQKPYEWELLRRKKPWGPSFSNSIIVQPTKIKLDGRVSHGIKVEDDKEFDLYDLTSLPDD